MNNTKYVIIKKDQRNIGLDACDFNDWSMHILGNYLTEMNLEGVQTKIDILNDADMSISLGVNETYVDDYDDDYYLIGDITTGSYNGYDPVPEGMLWIKRDQFIKMLQKWYELRSKGITGIMITKDGENFEMSEIV